jgi:tetratricopeptide (TPR) repeat protein
MESPLTTLRLKFAMLGTLLLVTTLTGCEKAPPPVAAKPAPVASPIPVAEEPAAKTVANDPAEPAEKPAGPALTLNEPAAEEEMPAKTEPAEPAEPVIRPAEVADEDAPKKPAKKVAEQPLPPRTSFDGKWIVVLTQGGGDFRVWLIDVANVATKADVKLLATSSVMASSVLNSASVEGDRITLALEAEGRKFDVTARLANGQALGAVSLAGRDVAMARLEPTAVTSMRAYSEGSPAEGGQKLAEAMEEGPKIEVFRDFLKEFPDSPLALDAHRMLLEMSLKTASAEELRKLIDDYTTTAARWDDRLALEARIQAAGALAGANTQIDMALELLDESEKKFDDTTPAPWKSLAKLRRGQALFAKGDADAGMKLFGELHAAQPFNVDITLALAQEARKADKLDVALPLYAELAALPMMERTVMRQIAQAGGKLDRSQLPSAIAKELYVKKNGSEDGFEKYLDEVYEKGLGLVSAEKVAPRGAEGGTRVVLCELFTGAECPPCVGADVATTGLEKTYAHSEVIVLRHHLHIPGPDPLANPHGQQRFEMYQGEGTPTVILNGRPTSGIGGGMDAAPDAIAQLRQQIDPILTEKVAYKIDLKAAAGEGGVVALTASVPGLEAIADAPQTLRLILVLAEDKVKYLAGNGIRVHEMVSRTFVNGAEGMAAKEGKLEFTGEINVEEVKASLLKYLVSAEGEFGNPFSAKPLELAGLHIVGILQDSKTGEVYQAATVPVTGVLATTAAPATTEPAPPAPEEKPKDE